MTDEVITVIALCISIPVAISYFKKVKGGNSKHDRFVEKAKRNGCVTTGVCVDTEYLSGDPDAKSLEGQSGAIEAKYQYRVEGVTYKKKLLFRNPGSMHIEHPKTIEIYYDMHNPKKAVSPVEFSTATRYQTGCLGAVGIWFILTAILVNLLKVFLQR